MIRIFIRLLLRDLRLAMRHTSDVVNPLVFFVIVVSLYPLSVTPELSLLSRFAPGIIWVAALLSVLLSLDRMFRRDYEDGTLDQILTSPEPLSLLVLAKILAHWVLTGLPLVLVSPLLGLLLGLETEAIKVLVLVLLLGTPALSLIGAIGVSLTLCVERASVLLSLIVLPLYIPILIFGANAVEVAATGDSVRGQLLFLGAVLALAVSLAPLATASALRITGSR